MTVGLVKIWNPNVPFLKEAIKIDARITTAKVAADAYDIGKYMIPIINATTRRGGIRSRICRIFKLQIIC